ATVNPTEETIEKFKRVRLENSKLRADKHSFGQDPVKTLDGFEVTIRANLDMMGGYDGAERLGAKGIGLFRSEFLFNQNRGFPTEDEQYANYARIADQVGTHGVRIRTFDLSADQLANRNFGKEKNPALGLRGIRLGFRFENEFRVQIRALLRAAYQRNVEILLPMISDVSEIIRVKEMIAQESASLRASKTNIGTPGLGAMIEIPSAVMVIDGIAEEADFISIGTNDLVQYLLAVDRDNEEVADWFRTLHPAVLRSVKVVLDSARKHNTPAIVCGEMAGSPLYAVILLGMGASELSMNIGSIERVVPVLSDIAYEEARSVVDALLTCGTPDLVDEMVRKLFRRHWEHLFDSNLLPPLAD
ncbi:MAG: phosphoenolpyruvate--protein phosphotransferase, partial [Acidobacteria bacterium]|nr:phosphoenolpyruvate--protein phosphotransferase [Acidobacteriota bacterium]